MAFPGIFRGALDVRATDVNDEMKIAAAKAIASLVEEDKLSEDYVIVSPFDARVAPAVAKAVAQAAIDTGVARRKNYTAEDVEAHTKRLMAEMHKDHEGFLKRMQAGLMKAWQKVPLVKK